MPWIVVFCEPRRELHVQEILHMRDHVTYLPKIEVQRRTIPMFPNYLFVQPLENQWYSIAKTPHVVYPLMAGDKPAELREQIVADLQNRERNGIVRLPRAFSGFRKGQPVRIIAGPCEGNIAFFEEQSSQERVFVLLALLGRQVRVQLAAKDLVPIPTHNRLRTKPR